MSSRPDSLGFVLADVSRLLRRDLNRRLESTGLTLAQARALTHISRNPGIRQVALADLLEVQPMTLVRTLDQLAGSGLVERRPDPSDRRAFRLYTTPRARGVLDVIAAVAGKTREVATRGIGVEDMKRLLDSLETIKRNLGESSARQSNGDAVRYG